MVHDLQPGDPQLVGPYRIRGVLGGGGMGRVFLGVSAEGRLVALKVVRADLAADPVFLARFRRETAVARKVSGPFTAPVIDADLDGPMPWLATAYVAGPSLADVVTGHGPMAPGSVLELAAALAEGLEAIHAAGVVHRDLKPAYRGAEAALSLAVVGRRHLARGYPAGGHQPAYGHRPAGQRERARRSARPLVGQRVADPAAASVCERVPEREAEAECNADSEPERDLWRVLRTRPGLSA